ncbi:MAG TPA: hypothetical protein VGK20_05535 [Candidatus Binatia bacterium]
MNAASIRAFVALSCALAVATCAPPAPQPCQRYDALSLNRENNFSSRVDWKSARMVNLAQEHVELAISAVRPMRGPLELVHVVGDTEADHWTVTVPDYNNAPVSLCLISPPGVVANCGASLQGVPLSPTGYWYLRTGENTVLEAGLSFFLCD